MWVLGTKHRCPGRAASAITTEPSLQAGYSSMCKSPVKCMHQHCNSAQEEDTKYHHQLLPPMAPSPGITPTWYYHEISPPDTMCSWTFYTTTHKVFFFFFARIQNKNQLKPLVIELQEIHETEGKAVIGRILARELSRKSACHLASMLGQSSSSVAGVSIKDGAGAWVPQAEPDATDSQTRGSLAEQHLDPRVLTAIKCPSVLKGRRASAKMTVHTVL